MEMKALWIGVAALAACLIVLRSSDAAPRERATFTDGTSPICQGPGGVYHWREDGGRNCIPPLAVRQQVVVMYVSRATVHGEAERPYAYACTPQRYQGEFSTTSIYCFYVSTDSIVYEDGTAPSLADLQSESIRHTMADVLKVQVKAWP
jgi:hypothetical protein